MICTFSLKWLDRETDVSVVRQREGEGSMLDFGYVDTSNVI